jgi:hypothetical protein
MNTSVPTSVNKPASFGLSFNFRASAACKFVANAPPAPPRPADNPNDEPSNPLRCFIPTCDNCAIASCITSSNASNKASSSARDANP